MKTFFFLLLVINCTNVIFKEEEHRAPFNSIFDNLFEQTRVVNKSEKGEDISSAMLKISPHYSGIIGKKTIFEVAYELERIPFGQEIYKMLKEYIKTFHSLRASEKMILILKTAPAIESFASLQVFNDVSSIITAAYQAGDVSKADVKYLINLDEASKKSAFQWLSELDTPFSKGIFKTIENDQEKLFLFLFWVIPLKPQKPTKSPCRLKVERKPKPPQV